MKLTTFISKLSLLFCLFLVSCSAQDLAFQDREIFYVHNDGATLPVVISGRDTEEIIIFVHGGPGSSGLLYYYADAWESVRQRYRMVFYDQRGSGGGRGHITEESITVDQHVDDLNVVVSLVEALYPNSKIYLFGHSYGGMIAAAYTSVHQNKLSGLMMLSPALNVEGLSTQIPSNMINVFIDPYLANINLSTEERRFWGEAKQFYLNNTPLKLDSFIKHNGYAHDADNVRGLNKFDEYYDNVLPRLLADPVLEPIIWSEQATLMLPILDSNKESQRNLETDPKFNLANIRIPALLLTGAKDLVVPESSSVQSFNVISSPVKVMKSYPDGSHNAFLEYPNIVPADIETFISPSIP